MKRYCIRVRLVGIHSMNLIELKFFTINTKSIIDSIIILILFKCLKIKLGDRIRFNQIIANRYINCRSVRRHHWKDKTRILIIYKVMILVIISKVEESSLRMKISQISSWFKDSFHDKILYLFDKFIAQ